LCRLLPARRDFMQTMTAEERAIMQAHVGYWTNQAAAGKALLFGPVADPAGGYGIGVIRVANMGEMEALRDADPAMRAGVGFRYEVLPMPQVVLGGAPPG
ncbi:MAG TPA: YciI family protein, partial [Devosia sp.]|nr:YciI family protein [Devosia sp.]